MFTGIVEAIGEIVELARAGDGLRLRIATPLASEMASGDSLAVNGVCLTVAALDATGIAADLGPETARITNLGRLTVGARVNLERPMRLDARLGGHLVLGHVDGLGEVTSVRAEAESHWLTIAFPRELAPFFIPKGSVAVDGVSLTVATLGDGQFAVQIIPYTWQQTTLAGARAGTLVNLECDLIGKYVVRAWELGMGRNPGP